MVNIHHCTGAARGIPSLKLIQFHCREGERWYPLTLTFSRGRKSNLDVSDHYAHKTEDWLKVCAKEFAGKQDEKIYCLARVWKTRECVNQSKMRWPLISCRIFPGITKSRSDCVCHVFCREPDSRRMILIIDKRSEEMRSYPFRLLIRLCWSEAICHPRLRLFVYAISGSKVSSNGLVSWIFHPRWVHSTVKVA